jgi:hypothetical protein
MNKLSGTSSPRTLAVCGLMLVLGICSATATRAGEINIYYKNLNGTLTLTSDQNGAEIGDPFCTATKCSIFIEELPAVDFPPQFLVAGVEIVDPGFVHPRTFTDLVHYSASNYLKTDKFSPCEDDPDECLADISLEFYANPFPFGLVDNSPTFQQPFADGMEHELTALFENPAINFPSPIVGLPAAAIHVFVQADGKNVAVPEPAALLLLCLGSIGGLFRTRQTLSN